MSQQRSSLFHPKPMVLPNGTTITPIVRDMFGNTNVELPDKNRTCSQCTTSVYGRSTLCKDCGKARLLIAIKNQQKRMN
jgi:hypothetical protein